LSDETALSKFTEGDIEARLTALAAVQDDPNQWAEILPDYGKEVALENVGDRFLGLFVTRRVVEVDDTNNPGQKRDATLLEFLGTDRERYAMWAGYSLENKFDHIEEGTPVLIEYRGKDEFKSDSGQPRTVKRFKVSMPVSGETR